ncbi:hypothetical protein, unlikely [Trypanosoma brucei gambiense DAL972]|uniref:Uncharacterized protein n=1 Tax=Trypanosoma brucei gambiense (strain MHOM/CI/86/DAL972) TaxID=679716 RepID=C9ZU15_TRYB9|nr:hypothetical protein, unlikely [Trypanosoma brucei gambiense DAL972]CBH12901.1 hypothetical protein, unlikely [Trypanosoma brucei gambiense DAL972]|eukprot:XP_011775180.1 hypothetical protein, unlikely [Trypanosoma brucei gambiense DAL972]
MHEYTHTHTHTHTRGKKKTTNKKEGFIFCFWFFRLASTPAYTFFFVVVGLIAHFSFSSFRLSTFFFKFFSSSEIEVTSLDFDPFQAPERRTAGIEGEVTGGVEKVPKEEEGRKQKSKAKGRERRKGERERNSTPTLKCCVHLTIIIIIVVVVVVFEGGTNIASEVNIEKIRERRFIYVIEVVSLP